MCKKYRLWSACAFCAGWSQSIFLAMCQFLNAKGQGPVFFMTSQLMKKMDILNSCFSDHFLASFTLNNKTTFDLSQMSLLRIRTISPAPGQLPPTVLPLQTRLGLGSGLGLGLGSGYVWVSWIRVRFVLRSGSGGVVVGGQLSEGNCPRLISNVIIRCLSCITTRTLMYIDTVIPDYPLVWHVEKLREALISFWKSKTVYFL